MRTGIEWQCSCGKWLDIAQPQHFHIDIDPRKTVAFELDSSRLLRWPPRVAVTVEVTKVKDGIVYFRSDDGSEAYRRISDVVPGGM